MKIIHPSRFQSRGFALVVTLALMILLTVIAVGLLSLSSISIRSTSQGGATQAARANARLALMMAIGDLQKQLGPDTRISGTADQIYDTNPLVSSTPQSQRHWCGAYQSWPAALPAESRPTPEFLQWFVSGDPAKLKQKSYAKEAFSGNSTNSVEMVTTNSVGASGDTVRVPMISQTAANGMKNHFAWWVGDEGVKAYVPSRPSLPENGTASQRYAMQTSPHFGLEVMATGAGKPFATFEHESIQNQKLVTWQQTSFAASSPEAIKLLFHDISVQNRGLLTNVRAGGFRQDLSMILQTPESSIRRDVLYKAGGRDGINLAELWPYHNLWTQLKSGGGNSYSSGGAISNSASYLQQQTSKAAMLTDRFYAQKQPVFIRFQQLLSFLAKPKSPATNPLTYELGIVVDPIITVWNPLDVPLSLQGSFMSVKYFALPYDLKVTFNGVDNKISLSDIVAPASTLTPAGYNFLTIRLGNSTTLPLILKPGEVMTFSQKNAPTTTTNAGLVDVKPGWVYDTTAGGFYYPFKSRNTSQVFRAGDATFDYSVTPNNDKSLGTSYASAHNIYYKSHDSSQESQQVGYYTINNRITASDSKYLSFFDKIASSPTVALSNLTSKRPFMIFSFLAKSEQDAENPGRFLARYNPHSIKLDFYDLEQNEQRMMPFEIKTQQVTSVVGMDKVVGESQINGNSYFGGGWTAEFGSTNVITHSVPRQAPVSLAAFQHALANGFPVDPNGRIINNTLNFLYPQASHAIGNSMACSLLDPDKTEGVMSGARPLADHSYLANQALWDDYFLSGISPQTAAVFSNKRDQKDVARGFLDDSTPLPVKAYKPSLQGSDADQILGKLFSGSSPATGAEKLTAALISVDGMFNVNSTSVEAWKALLSGLRDRDIMGQSPLGGDDSVDADGATANASLLTPNNSKVLTDSGNDLGPDGLSAQWKGVHMISDMEIEALAKAIVGEVRKRGPFLSLADFVNRRVGTDKDLALSGAIQSALDADSVTINKVFRAGDRASKGSEAGLAFPEAERGAAAYGIPGYVKQADILTPIAPLLSARSDTFTIRGYGEVADTSGKVLAKAWCEAVVQRNADFVDPLDEITKPLDQLQSQVNKAFGRRFEMVSFRWLSPAEV